ncbi:MAG: Imidazole glycerol phosphate synthase subunit HisH [candidate division CPR1 bacterium GW2011_GWA2_42_17]|uniref:Imidazole glycerol phosphate synthase subunit HisH n=1 Tax=candidate division CPR1 bacterium GW2011_GWA2_42_17 TaxID=1618341 RepID=A0A0G0Z2J9_9BACT|nr:MAG: Imidazole glycerol phosphate synthase subunit HisH [candidate division CPR1 bacterium GW2011_GWA2_42_17]
MNCKLLVIDYGVVNIQSVVNALNFLGYTPWLSAKKADIEKADIYIFPGIGAFAEAMKNLKNLRIIETLNRQILIAKKPILGICLGMQVLAEDSEEYGFHQGLGWIKGHVKKMLPTHQAKIPHIGWNPVTVVKKLPLFFRTNSTPAFYFDHSYEFVCPQDVIAATCRHGKDVVAAIQKDNIFGVQFHPEKSQIQGLKLLRGFMNFAEKLC